MLRFFRDFMSTAPDELQALAYLTSAGNGTFLVLFVYSGNLNEGEKLLNTFRKFKAPLKDWVQRRKYFETYTMPPYTAGNDGATPCPFHVIKGSYIEVLSDESLILYSIALHIFRPVVNSDLTLITTCMEPFAGFLQMQLHLNFGKPVLYIWHLEQNGKILRIQ